MVIDIQEFQAREEQRIAEFNAGMAKVRERRSGGGNVVSDRSTAQRRENLSLLSTEDLVELVMQPCKRCEQHRLDMFKMSDHPTLSKFVWEVTLENFEEPFTATDEFLEEATDALHVVLSATLDAHGYDASKTGTISVE